MASLAIRAKHGKRFGTIGKAKAKAKAAKGKGKSASSPKSSGGKGKIVRPPKPAK